MKNNLTELVFILDRSGSMMGLEKDTIGGFNAMIEKQKKEEGEAFITTVLFDNKYELLHDRINIKGVSPISEKEYFVRGTTALLDAVGKTINKIENAQKHTLESERASKVLFVITTDGMENSSTRYSYEKIRRMIEEKKKEFGWEFIFLGANIDAVRAAESIGISEDRATNYNCDSEGTRLNYEVISETVSCLRTNKNISDNWKNKIEVDYKKRGGKI
ncbi:vWA domain-containing protein [Clostridium tertium]